MTQDDVIQKVQDIIAENLGVKRSEVVSWKKVNEESLLTHNLSTVIGAAHWLAAVNEWTRRLQQ